MKKFKTLLICAALLLVSSIGHAQEPGEEGYQKFPDHEAIAEFFDIKAVECDDEAKWMRQMVKSMADKVMASYVIEHPRVECSIKFDPPFCFTSNIDDEGDAADYLVSTVEVFYNNDKDNVIPIGIATSTVKFPEYSVAVVTRSVNEYDLITLTIFANKQTGKVIYIYYYVDIEIKEPHRQG